MSGFQRFDDILAWQVGVDVISAIHALWTEERSRGYYWLREQMFRAALSITNNIAEGFGRGSDAEFARFLGYSRGSASEVLSCLRVSQKLGLMAATDIDPITHDLDRCLHLISKLQSYLNPNRLREADQPYAVEAHHGD